MSTRRVPNYHRRHFEDIAWILNQLPTLPASEAKYTSDQITEAQRRQVVRHFGNLLAETNKGFDMARFLEAAGIPPEEQ